MNYKYALTTLSLAAALALAGCGSDGTNGAPGADGADGAGAVSTLNERFSGGGTWAVTAVDTAGLGGPITALTYNADTDDWLFTVGGTAFTLDLLTAGTYSETGCTPGLGTTCATFTPDGGSLADRFGTFAKVTIDDGAAVDAGYTHYGFGTADMPAIGTGSYSGTFQGDVDNAGTPDTLSGTTTIEVDFGAVGDQVTFASEGNGAANAGAATYGIAGTALITGNSYSGGLSTAQYDADGDPLTLGDNTDYLVGTLPVSALSGTFYGNVAQETAGVVSAADGDGNSLIGGFEASGVVVGGTVE